LPAGRSNLVQDEARVGQQGTLTRIWAKRGRARASGGPAVHLAYCSAPSAGTRTGAAWSCRLFSIDAMTHICRNQQMRQRQCHCPANPRRCWLAQSPQLILPKNIVLMRFVYALS